MRIEFDGVSRLRLKSTGPGPIQIAGFDIVDISDRRWESLRFEVGDYEDARISFYCRTFRVVAADDCAGPD